MSGLFGGGKPPAPQPVPLSPMDDSVAIAERNKAAQNAADAKMRGRQSTAAFGAKLAAEEQYDRGLLKSKSRAASREMLG